MKLPTRDEFVSKFIRNQIGVTVKAVDSAQDAKLELYYQHDKDDWVLADTLKPGVYPIFVANFKVKFVPINCEMNIK